MLSKKNGSTSHNENYRDSTSAALKRLNIEVRKIKNGKYVIDPGVANRIANIYGSRYIESPPPSPHLGNTAWGLPAELRESYHFKKEVKWKARTTQEKEQALRLVGKKTINLKNLISSNNTKSIDLRNESAKPSFNKSNQVHKPPKIRYIKTPLKP